VRKRGVGRTRSERRGGVELSEEDLDQKKNSEGGGKRKKKKMRIGKEMRELGGEPDRSEFGEGRGISTSLEVKTTTERNRQRYQHTKIGTRDGGGTQGFCKDDRKRQKNGISAKHSYIP